MSLKQLIVFSDTLRPVLVLHDHVCLAETDSAEANSKKPDQEQAEAAPEVSLSASLPRGAVAGRAVVASEVTGGWFREAAVIEDGFLGNRS